VKAQVLPSLRRAKEKTIEGFGARMAEIAKTPRLNLPWCKMGPVYNSTHFVGPRAAGRRVDRAGWAVSVIKHAVMTLYNLPRENIPGIN
jgi:hypothetical protein